MDRVVAEAPSGTVGTRTGRAFIALYAAAYVGTWLALLTPIMITLPLRAREIAPDGAELSHSLVLGAGALFALVGNPLFGWLSDRTTSSWGMRRPWLAGGAIAGTVSLALVTIAPSIPWLLVGWCLAQLSFNAVLAPLAALLPDQIPAEKRGTVAGILSITTPVGQVAGTYLVHLLGGNILAMLMVPAAICLVLVLLLVAVLPDRRASATQMTRLDWRELTRSFRTSPRQAPDFAWVCVGRFCLIVCMTVPMAYQPFLLMNRLAVAEAQVTALVFRATLVQSLMLVIAGLTAGWLSDRTSRRKPFAIGAGTMCALGCAVLATAPSLDVYLAGAAILGLGLGAYLSVDLALVTDVLPNRRDDAAKDLGLFNVASTSAQIVAPLIASLILLQTGNYAVLFFAAAAAGALAAAAILPVRSAR